MIVLIALGALIATMIGGLFAIKWSDKLHLIVCFSAGALMGVALLDLLPEAMAIGAKYWGYTAVAYSIIIGFFVYFLLDHLVFKHRHVDEGKGVVGAASLSAHSLLDGIALGIAFHVSAAIGAVVAAAVLAHDFSDGINTVAYILRNGGTKKQAFRWLSIDAFAPVAGVILTFLFVIPESYTGLVLGFFSGCFIFIGGSDLLPEMRHSHIQRWPVLLTVLGAAAIGVAVKLAGM